MSTLEGTVYDPQKLPVPQAEVRLAGASIAERASRADVAGVFRIAALPPGTYRLTVAHPGFSTRAYGLEIALNRTVRLDVVLEVGREEQTVVEGKAPLLETTSSSTGSTILPREIASLPINGRNYLDLMQLVPGVAINRWAEGSDAGAPVLGERAGNTSFLIDGLSNRNEVDGGPAAQFNQETIAEFEVVTTGYRAEFGHGSGGVVNVVTKSGTNDWHVSGSLFHRNDALDASNVKDTDVPFLRRYDSSLAASGPIVKDKAFFFASAEHIAERRRLNFVFPKETPPSLRQEEERFDDPTRDHQTRIFAKLDEQLGRHRLTQLLNWTEAKVRDVGDAEAFPSLRTDSDRRTFMLGATDIALLGSADNPLVLTLRAQFRDEPSRARPSHPDAGPATVLNLFSRNDTGQLFGDAGQFRFGYIFDPSRLDQKYAALGTSLTKNTRRHSLKAGWDYTHTRVDGNEPDGRFHQLFATVDDFARFGAPNAGVELLFLRTGRTPESSRIRLRNHYNGLFAQDDWKIRKDLTLNLGLRWDLDSRFPDKRNVSPRLGAAWTLGSKTVVRGSWGLFYDHFRLGIAQDVPEFGGADMRFTQPVAFPRLFYGVPTTLSILLPQPLCLSPNLTDVEIAARGVRCSFGPMPLLGVDHLNWIVATGHAPIPADSVVTVDTIEALSGLTPREFADAASRAVGYAPGYFFWGPFGTLTSAGFGSGTFPIAIVPGFKTPYTRSMSLGVQREIARDLVLALDYYHKDIRNILGQRVSNIRFESRVPGYSQEYPSLLNGFGPWYKGRYDAVTVSVDKRFAEGFLLGGSYTRANATDNLPCPAPAGPTSCGPSDSFVGFVPVVTDGQTGQTNAGGSFVASNGNFIPKAGTFLNGPDLDKGKSDLAVDQTFESHWVIALPWRFEISGILRVQSGFHFSRRSQQFADPDGDNSYTDADLALPRNSFKAPPFRNLDLRATKRFALGKHARATLLVEFFNILNRPNPSAVQSFPGQPVAFGQATQVLPGREGQIGVRLEF